MEGEVVTKAGGLITFGAMFLWLGISGWKDRRRERINIIEAAIAKSRQIDPAPSDRWDRAIAYIQPVMMMLFGPCMIAGGIAMLWTSWRMT